MEHFVPTIASAKASPQKNLTGNPRIIKDLAASIHADIQQWNSIHLHGVSLLKSIVAMKVDDSYPEGLQELCDELEKDVNQLDRIVDSLKVSVQQTKAVNCLHKGQDNLFITWPVKRFVDTAQQIYDAYRDEAILKRKILENVAHDSRDSWKMLHLTSWVYQPLIPYDLNVTLEALLNETGHR